MNKENLIKMAEYIKTVPQKKFNMSSYRSGSVRTHKCKSIGCVVGHCTILDDEDNLPIDEHMDIDFSAWSERFTGLSQLSDEWQWCFGCFWSDVDNTPLGASKRIMWIVENGLPDDWKGQMYGIYELCYL